MRHLRRAALLHRQRVWRDDRHRLRGAGSARALARRVVVDAVEEVDAVLVNCRPVTLVGVSSSWTAISSDDLLVRRECRCRRVGSSMTRSVAVPVFTGVQGCEPEIFVDADEAHVRGGRGQVVDDAHVVERERIRRRGNRDAIAEDLADSRSRLRVRLGQRLRRRRGHAVAHCDRGAVAIVVRRRDRRDIPRQYVRRCCPRASEVQSVQTWFASGVPGSGAARTMT